MHLLRALRSLSPEVVGCQPHCGFGFWVLGLGLGFGVWGLGFGVWGFGIRDSGFGFRVSGFGFTREADCEEGDQADDDDGFEGQRREPCHPPSQINQLVHWKNIDSPLQRPGSWFRVPGVVFQRSGSGFRVSGFGFRGYSRQPARG